MEPTGNQVGGSSERQQVIVASVVIVLGSVALGWLLVVAAKFRGVYVAAGMRMPVLVDIAGHYPWVLLAGVVLSELIVALLAWRSQRPAFWLTVEASALAGIAFLLISVFAGNVYRPIHELDSALRGGR